MATVNTVNHGKWRFHKRHRKRRSWVQYREFSKLTKCVANRTVFNEDSLSPFYHLFLYRR